MGGRDDGPRPLSGRTWQQGIEWARRPVLELDVATANVCELPRHDATIDDDFAKIEKAGVDLVMWQELGNRHYKSELRKMPRLKHEVLRAREDYSTPISHDHALIRPFHRKAKIIQPGVKKVTPNRFLTSVRYRVVAAPKVRIAAHSGHLVSRAFRGDGKVLPRANRREALEQPARQVLWRAGRRLILRRMRAVAKAGLPQVLGIDQNRKNVSLLPKELRGYRVQIVKDGLDWLYFVDGADYVWDLVGSKKLIQTNGDHPVVVQRARLVPRKR